MQLYAFYVWNDYVIYAKYSMDSSIGKIQKLKCPSPKHKVNVNKY